MAFYHCVEDDRILSTEQLRSDFEGFQLEGAYVGETFDDYLTGCMWWNNGALTPLLDHLADLRRDLARVKSYGDPDDDEWIDTLSAQIAECEKCYLEV